ncbi:MAG TPA: carboxypeptidase-like regulatory domain-containing protein, partial [Phnomibacter sp.]|nr:carboxypeptidase-like regulatory domain-containing protein [Phnomibacter sp.]
MSGTVKDANGAPVAGASVREKGTRNGTVANDAGAFTLSVAQGARLVITATGFGEMEVASNGNLNIQLAEKAS